MTFVPKSARLDQMGSTRITWTAMCILQAIKITNIQYNFGFFCKPHGEDWGQGNTLRGFSFCLVQIIVLYSTNSLVDSFCFIIVSIINVEFVTSAMGSGVSLLCESRFDIRVLRSWLQSFTQDWQLRMSCWWSGGRFLEVYISVGLLYRSSLGIKTGMR